MIVVCDTTPLNYLLLIGEVQLLPVLYERICIPAAVRREMQHPKAPQLVRSWVSNPPDWVFFEEDLPISSPEVLALDAGESQAIAAFELLQADFLLTDDWAARRLAETRGIRVVTTLLILDAAADRGLIHFEMVAEKLIKTNFRVETFLIDQLLEKHKLR